MTICPWIEIVSIWLFVKLCPTTSKRWKKGEGWYQSITLTCNSGYVPLMYIFLSTNSILIIFITFLNNSFIISQMITDFGRHPDFRKKLDVDKLANSVRSWPGIKYNVSACKSVRKIPYRCPPIYYFWYI